MAIAVFTDGSGDTRRVMQQISLRIIPEPAPGTRKNVISRDSVMGHGPFVRGAGDTDQICGNCETVLAASVNLEQITNTVFQCPLCGLYNDTDSEAAPLPQ